MKTMEIYIWVAEGEISAEEGVRLLEEDRWANLSRLERFGERLAQVFLRHSGSVVIACSLLFAVFLAGTIASACAEARECRKACSPREADFCGWAHRGPDRSRIAVCEDGSDGRVVWMSGEAAW